MLLRTSDVGHGNGEIEQLLQILPGALLIVAILLGDDLDHLGFVHAEEDEARTRRGQEVDGFQHLHEVSRRAAIEIVDEDDEPRIGRGPQGAAGSVELLGKLVAEAELGAEIGELRVAAQRRHQLGRLQVHRCVDLDDHEQQCAGADEGCVIEPIARGILGFHGLKPQRELRPTRYRSGLIQAASELPIARSI